MLVYTPQPNSDESLFGYIIRVSELNGYDTPRHILNHAGYKYGEIRSTFFDVKKFNAILGKNGNNLHNLAYSVTKNGKTTVKVLGHDLGKTARGFINVHTPQICPQCIKEKGYIDSFWDLSLAVACPKHKCLSVSKCPVCKENLKSLRPGILKCRCNADLYDKQIKKNQVNIDILELLNILRTKLSNESIVELENISKYPLHILNSQSLSSLIIIINKLGKFNLYSKNKQETTSPFIRISEASDVLRNWPKGYHDFLNRIGFKFINNGIKNIGLRKQFEKFYISFFKSKHKSDYDPFFLKKEFIKFGLESWGKATIDEKLLKHIDIKSTKQRFQSRSQIISNNNIWQPTLKLWLKNGSVKSNEIMIGKKIHHIIDLSSSNIIHTNNGKIYKLREAAKFISIPVSILKNLKDSGYYKSLNIPPQKNGFHETDLYNFMNSINKINTSTISFENNSKKYFSLEYILKQVRFWSENGKANFLKAYIDSSIQSSGQTGNTFKDIWFDQGIVNDFAENCRNVNSGKTISQEEASKIVGCDHHIIKSLIEKKYLHSLSAPNRIRIKKISVEKFIDNFIFLSKISKILITSSPRLLKLCKNNNIKILFASRNNDIDSPFIQKKQYERLQELCNLNPTREEIRKTNKLHIKTALEKLQEYLSSLKKSDRALPKKKNGEPNKAKIAQECRINRSNFYISPEIKNHLEKFLQDEME